jgi:hypothetical protein
VCVCLHTHGHWQVRVGQVVRYHVRDKENAQGELQSLRARWKLEVPSCPKPQTLNPKPGLILAPRTLSLIWLPRDARVGFRV